MTEVTVREPRTLLFDLEVRAAGGGNLRQVGDAEHLEGLAKAAQLFPYHRRHAAADARIDLVEDSVLSGWSAAPGS